MFIREDVDYDVTNIAINRCVQSTCLLNIIHVVPHLEESKAQNDR